MDREKAKGIRKTPEILRFMRGIDLNADGCWVWRGSQRQGGYGSFKTSAINGDSGTMISAHRFSYRYFVGVIPDNLQIDHLCRNRICVNPDHLEPVTCSVNVHRGRDAMEPQTHCVNGHELSKDNVYIAPKTGGRGCKICRLIQSKKYTEKRLEQKKS